MIEWIRINRSLPTHWKSQELCDELENPLAWAFMVKLWCWCVDNAPDGNIPGSNPERTLERACGWTGDAGRLALAAVRCGFVDKSEAGLAVHGWEEHNGKPLRHAEEEARRLKEYREKKKALRQATKGAQVELRPMGVRDSTESKGVQEPHGVRGSVEMENAQGTENVQVSYAYGTRTILVPDETRPDETRRKTVVEEGEPDPPESSSAEKRLQREKPKRQKALAKELATALWERLQVARLAAVPGVKPEVLDWSKLGPRLALVVSELGEDGVERAWAAYLTSDYGRKRSPRFCFEAFSTLEQLRKFDDLAAQMVPAKPSQPKVPCFIEGCGVQTDGDLWGEPCCPRHWTEWQTTGEHAPDWIAKHKGAAA